MSIIRVAGYKKHSFVDGPGVRFALFMQGCPHACPGCHNPETWSREGGFSTDTTEIIEQIRHTRFIDGVTLSGGDPLLQAEASIEIARASRELGLSVWAYTGWTFEQILDGVAGPVAQEALQYFDVLVDGRFIASRAYRRDETYGGAEPVFCGSSNQRLIDVPISLKTGRCHLYEARRDMKMAN